ncbi:head-tail connector protein [uncultured Clostridium sp.]|uniref:head-tail connector protein n=1 Tax=uncultured Clostridium sp. TaxID=59620 RepID=UPI0027DC6046|nr:head-tail connector protein [uncultured Clostridium sp.]
MVISLEEAKLFLRVDSGEEDTLITKFIIVAEDICQGIIRYELTEFENIPECIKQSVLYAVVNMYEQRENFDVKNVIETMTRLLFSYRKDSW